MFVEICIATVSNAGLEICIYTHVQRLFNGSSRLKACHVNVVLEIYEISITLIFPNLVKLNTVLTLWKIKNRLGPEHISGNFKLITISNNRRKEDLFKVKLILLSTQIPWQRILYVKLTNGRKNLRSDVKARV